MKDRTHARQRSQVRANKANALKSSGPKTPEGKANSRGNSYKHGLTGAGVVIPQREAAEVERRVVAFHEELKPSGEVGQALVRRVATMSVRMERCVEHENAILTERVRQAEADFVPPEGVDKLEADRLRAEAGKRALFDPSPEATLARKYETAAERSFFRALKELRVLERKAKAADDELFEGESGSFLPGEMSDEEFDTLYIEATTPSPPKPAAPLEPVDLAALKGRADLPFAIGRRR